MVGASPPSQEHEPLLASAGGLSSLVQSAQEQEAEALYYLYDGRLIPAVEQKLRVSSSCFLPVHQCNARPRSL